MDQPQVVSSQANIITSTMIIIFIMRITVIIPISMIITIIFSWLSSHLNLSWPPTTIQQIQQSSCLMVKMMTWKEYNRMMIIWIITITIMTNTMTTQPT